MESLKRIVIKEELVALTGDYRKAIILNQFLYWTERVKDFDKFIVEEKIRYKLNGEENKTELQNGWIYKTSEELSEETMLGLSKSNIRLHIKSLIESGWIDERTNPNFKWDRTMQYRVNIVKLQEDLYKLGYALEGYPLFFHEESKNEDKKDEIESEKFAPDVDGANKNNDDINPRSFKTEHRSSKTEPREFQQKSDIKEIKHRSSKIEPRCFKTELRGSKTEQQYQRLLTENNNIYLYSQSVNNTQDNNLETEDGQEDKNITIKEIKKKIIAMGYPCLEEEMILNSLSDITRTKGLKYIDKLMDKNIIDFALKKFKKLDKAKIKNPQAYFTSVLTNSVFEYAASAVAGTEQSVQDRKPVNKFHNFMQRTYEEGELEEFARKKFEKRVQELKVEKERANEDGFNNGEV